MEHWREVRAQWIGIEVGDKRNSNQLDHQQMADTNDDLPIDEVGILNLENMMDA